MSGNGHSKQTGTWAGYGDRAGTAAERARDVARQVAERQKEIAAEGIDFASKLSFEAQRPMPGFYTADGKTFLGPLPAKDEPFTPDQRELRQLLAVKLRALAASVEGINSTRPATAGEIQREVARLGDIAGALK